MKNILRFLQDDSGATAIEYGLLASLIGIALITIVTQLGTTLVERFETINSNLANAGQP